VSRYNKGEEEDDITKERKDLDSCDIMCIKEKNEDIGRETSRVHQ
jgi:hypothetical protein